MDTNVMKALIIAEGIQKAYKTQIQEDLITALDLAKMVSDHNNEPIKEIIQELRKYDITAIWSKVDSGCDKQNQLGLRYKDMAFEIQK